MSSTIAKSLWPDQDKIGQCEAQREGRYLNDTPETDKRCAHSVKFEVDGKRLCARHAAQAALRVLLGSSRDEFISAAIADARHFEKHRDELLAAAEKLGRHGWFIHSNFATDEQNADMQAMRTAISRNKGDAA